MAESSPLFGFDPSTTTVVGNYSKAAEAQGDIANITAQAKSQQAPFDFLGVGKQIAAVSGIAADKKNMIDAHTAKLRATEFMQNNSHLSGHELSESIKNEITTISDSGNYSTGYQKGALAVFDIGYNQALERKEEERVVSSMNVVSSNFGVQIADNMANGLPMSAEWSQTWAANTAAEMKLPVESVRNAMVSSYYQDAQMRVVTARNKKELAEAQKYITEAGKSLNSPLFLDSRSKKFQPVIKQLKTNFNSSVTAKKKEFQEAARVHVELNVVGEKNNLWNTNPGNPILHAEDIRESVNTDAEFIVKMRTLTNDYNKAEEARSIVEGYNPYEIKPLVTTVNKLATAEINNIVYAEVLKNIENPNAFITLANRNPDAIGFAGKQLVNAFNVTDNPESLTQMANSFKNIQSFPKGSLALQRVFGDDYKNIISTMVIADYMVGGDVAKARGMVAEAKGSLVQQSIHPNIKDRMYKNSYDLGTLGDEYLYTINTILNVNAGAVDKGLLDDIYEKFAEGIEEREGIKTNVSVKDTAANTLEPDVFNKSLASTLTTLNGGILPSGVKNLSNNTMIYTDEFGFTTGAFNAGPLAEITNSLTEAMAIQDQKEVDTTTKLLDSFDALLSNVSFGFANMYSDEVKEKDIALHEQFKAIWGTEDVDREKISTTVDKFRDMFPLTIDAEAIPDYDARKNIEAYNAQMQSLITEVATNLLGKTEEEQATEEVKQQEWETETEGIAP